MRIGFGFDVHRVVEGRPMILGGKHIPYEKGCLGHSDADVLLHAICDSMLGALALGDIGKHFPDTSSDYKNIDSKILLKKVQELINDKGYKLGNLDCTLVAEQPRINPHVADMVKIISMILETDQENVSIKATTNEKLGFIGREEGMTAYAVCILVKK